MANFALQFIINGFQMVGINLFFWIVQVVAE